MRTIFKALIPGVLALTLIGWSATSYAGGSIGGGIHYLRNLGDISTSTVNLDQNSFSLIGSYQHGLALLKVEGNLEYIFNYIGTNNSMWEPSAYVLTSGLIYGGAGIGIGYIDGDWQNDPFYALRLGVNFGLAGLALDVYGTYRFQNDSDLKALTGEDLNSVTFAALVRFGM
jgi:hypothetical protein